MSNQGQAGPKHSDIKIKLVLKSFGHLLKAFCIFCAYTIET